MNKRLSKGFVASLIIMLLAGTFAVFPVHAAPGPVISLSDPYGPLGQYKWNTGTVPTQFNVTIWVTNAVAWKLMMFQLYITFNPNILNITSFVGSVTGRPDAVMAWPNNDLNGTGTSDRAWDPQYVFFMGAGGSIGNPTFYPAGAVKWGDTLGGNRSLAAGVAYKLGCIQFNVTKMPGKFEVLSCTLGINNLDTYMSDSVGPIPDITKTDGYYELTWALPPKPHCQVMPASTVFEKWWPAVGKTVDINLYIMGLSGAWGLTNATCTIAFNTTLIDALGAPAANITLNTVIWDPVTSVITVTHAVPDTIKFVVYPKTAGPSGDVLVATIKFTVMHQNTYPQPDESTDIWYTECLLFDHTQSIPTDASVKGTVKIEAFLSLTLPWFEVSPTLVELGPAPAIGKTFKVDVKIVNLQKEWFTVGVQFRLKYDDTLLAVVDVTEGPFMKNPTWNTHGTYFVSYPHETDPNVLVGNMLLPNGTGQYDQTTFPNGAGVIATITFKAIKQDKEPCYYTGGFLTCNLTLQSLFGQWAIDKNGNYILVAEAKNVNGVYRIFNTPSTGRFIDLYGGAKNAGYWTGYPDPFPVPYGGQGLGTPMDLVIPQSEVTFYAIVEYNCWPVQSKDVGFEIEGPYIKVITIDPETEEEIITYEPKLPGYMIWAKLTARTDSNGIAKITFRMPWPCEDPEDVTGIWLVTATVNLADEIVVDTLMYYYEYLVYITKVTTDKYYYYHDDTVTVCVEYATHALQDLYPALFAIVIQDELGVPFGMDATFETDIPADLRPIEDWCTWEEGRFCVDIYIPKWAFAGFAYVHVSVYDKDPTEGGFAWGPEYTPLPEIYIMNLAPPTVVINPPTATANKTKAETKTFTATASGGSGGYTYKWYADDLSHLIQSGPSNTLTIDSQWWSPGTHTIIVVVTDSWGYSGTAIATLKIVV